MKKFFNKIPRYILVYYGYALIYAMFWLIVPRIMDKDLILLYCITTIVAVGWMGYMLYRLLVRHDKNVSALVLITNLILVEVISRTIYL